MPLNTADPRPNDVYHQVVCWDEGDDAKARTFA